MSICSNCEKVETEFTCDQCGKPVCEDCCAVMTIHNQIDYPLCLLCEGDNESARYETASREHELEEKKRKEKEEKSAARKAAYWKPRAIEKRRLAKEERRRLAAEAARKRAETVAKIMSDMFKGMF